MECLYFDLNKEKGFKDKFFEDKYDYLLGYKEKINIGTSEKSPLNFHLSHITDKNFSFENAATTNSLLRLRISILDLSLYKDSCLNNPSDCVFSQSIIYPDLCFTIINSYINLP